MPPGETSLFLFPQPQAQKTTTATKGTTTMTMTTTTITTVAALEEAMLANRVFFKHITPCS